MYDIQELSMEDFDKAFSITKDLEVDYIYLKDMCSKLIPLGVLKVLTARRNTEYCGVLIFSITPDLLCSKVSANVLHWYTTNAGCGVKLFRYYEQLLNTLHIHTSYVTHDAGKDKVGNFYKIFGYALKGVTYGKET